MSKLAIGNADASMDIVQDTMLKLVQKYSHKPSEQWRPLFFRILNNKITDYYRRQAVRKKIFLMDLKSPDEEDNDRYSLVAAARHSDNPDFKLQSDRRLEKLIEAVSGLSIRQRQVFILRCWEGMSTADTASAMRCAQGSVKTHYSRALHNLRDILEEYRDD
jgi:RNA polymerase sigma-70 factor (ECF subfamily)